MLVVEGSEPNSIVARYSATDGGDLLKQYTLHKGQIHHEVADMPLHHLELIAHALKRLAPSGLREIADEVDTELARKHREAAQLADVAMIA